MKHFLLFAAILFTFPLAAQLPFELNKLDGRWYAGTKEAPICTHWNFISDGLLENHTYVLNGSDTLTQFRARVFQEADKTILEYQERDGSVQTFELGFADKNTLSWQNQNPGATPTCLLINFLTVNKLTYKGWGADDQTFRHSKGAPLQVGFGVQGGLSGHNLRHQKILPAMIQQPAASFSEGIPGQNFSFFLKIKRGKSPLSLNVEAGILHLRYNARYAMPAPGKVFVREGQIDYAHRYVAVLPEGRFGKHQNWSFFAGMMMSDNYAIKYGGNLLEPFTGSEQNIATPKPSNLKMGLSPVLGLSWGPSFMAKGPIKPALTLRMTGHRVYSLGFRVDFIGNAK